MLGLVMGYRLVICQYSTHIDELIIHLPKDKGSHHVECRAVYVHLVAMVVRRSATNIRAMLSVPSPGEHFLMLFDLSSELQSSAIIILSYM